jgi:hypothetical protein
LLEGQSRLSGYGSGIKTLCRQGEEPVALPLDLLCVKAWDGEFEGQVTG